MKTMAISEFKAKCLAVLDQVRRTHRPVLVTRRGVPIAEVVPPPPAERPANWLGCMSGTIEEIGDIVSPASDPHDWEVLR